MVNLNLYLEKWWSCQFYPQLKDFIKCFAKKIQSGSGGVRLAKEIWNFGLANANHPYINYVAV